MTGIYKITNLINGKSYIGQSINIEQRFQRHRQTAFNANNKHYNYPLYKAIRKYNIENFSFDVVEECSEHELDEKEMYYIKFYNTYGDGYNQDKGGHRNPHYIKLSEELVDQIILRLKTTLDSSECIGEAFNVSGRTIRSINSGEYCYRESEKYPIRPPLYSLDTNRMQKTKEYYCKICGKKIITQDSMCVECACQSQRVVDRPEPLELAKLIKEYGFTGTGKIFNVSDNSIKQWCKSYNIPHLKNELISWYDNVLGIKDVVTPKSKKIDQRKEVKQIDPITYQVLNIFPSENAAARSLGKTYGTHIGEVCRGVHKLAYGFKWEYV